MLLDTYQEQVVKAPKDANMKVIGAPGSGKTYTLVMRYVHLVVREHVDPDRILAITFSKKAAKEMAKRIQLRVDIRRSAANNISTMNAFCYRLYNKWRISAGLEPLKVWDYGSKHTNPDYKAADLMNEHLRTRDLSVFDHINKTLSSVPRPNKLTLQEMTDWTLTRSESGYLIWQGYQKWMKDRNLVDFYGQVWNVDRLIDANPIFARMVGMRFDKIIGDEFQDMFPQTYRIILKLAEQSSLEVYADPSQSIYGFNGAEAHMVHELDRLVPKLQNHHLSNNYRSSKAIVDVINAFGPETTSLFQPMNCVKEDEPGQITIHGVDRISDQADYIANEMERHDYKPRDVFVLCRTNGQCSSIYHRMLELGVPAFYAGNFSIWDKTYMKAAIGYMSLAQGNDDPGDVAAVLNIPSEDYSTRGAYSPTRFLANSFFRGKTLKGLLKMTGLKPYQRDGIINLNGFVSRLQGIEDKYHRAIEIEKAISKWAQWTGGDYMAVESDLAMVWDKLDNINYDVSALRQYIEKLKRLKQKVKAGANVVNIMTIHQAKGLENKVVFLTGLSEPVSGSNRGSGFHPGRNENPLTNEENCLFYVGGSRAIFHLYLTYYENSGKTEYNISSFVKLLARRIAKWPNLEMATS